jgi:hypothetical protein
MNAKQLTDLIRRRRTIRQRCEAALRSVPRIVPFSAEALCAAIATQLGRPIALRSDAGQGGLSGWVESTATGFIIHFDPDPTADRQNIILHELSHIHLGHLDESLEHLAAPPPYLSEVPLSWLRTLRGGTYVTIQEQEAELLAALIRLRDGARLAPEDGASDPEARGIIDRWHRFYFEDGER